MIVGCIAAGIAAGVWGKWWLAGLFWIAAALFGLIDVIDDHRQRRYEARRR